MRVRRSSILTILDIENGSNISNIEPEQIETFIIGIYKRLIEKALEGELSAHLGYEK